MCRNRCVKYSNEPDITVAPYQSVGCDYAAPRRHGRVLGVLGGEEASTIPRCCWPRPRAAASSPGSPPRPPPILGDPDLSRREGEERHCAPSPASLTGTALPRRLPCLLTREAGTYEWTPASRREAEGGDVPQSCAPDCSAAVVPAARA